MTETNYVLFNDLQLTDLLKAGDHRAYTEIYQRYKGVLYLHAYKRLGDREEAKDLIQDLFTILWNKRDEFVLKSHLSGYLYTAVRNRVIKVISHKQIASDYISEIGATFDNSDVLTDYLIREKELKSIIEKEIDALPEKMREIFNMSRKEHLTHREIAEILGVKESTVKKQVNNSLKILRNKLGAVVFFLFISNF